MEVFSEVIGNVMAALKSAQLGKGGQQSPIEIVKADILEELTLSGKVLTPTESAKANIGVAWLDMSMSDFLSAEPRLKNILNLIDEQSEPGLYAGALKLYSDTQDFLSDEKNSNQILSTLIENYNKSSQMLLNVCDFEAASEAFKALSQCQFYKGEFDQAVISSKEALKLCDTDVNTNPYYIHALEELLAKALLKLGRPEEALKHAIAGLINIQTVMRGPDRSRLPLIKTYGLIGEIYLELNEKANALASYQNMFIAIDADSKNETELKLKSEAEAAIKKLTKARVGN